MPDFPIDFVRTGQFREGVVSSKRLWSVRVDFAEVERAQSAPRNEASDWIDRSGP